MKALIIYESMYGNTHAVADAIGAGWREHGDVSVVPVDGAAAAFDPTVDVVIVGGPTHGHGMSRASTRQGAVAAAAKSAEVPGHALHVDPDAEGPGLRDWFESAGSLTKRAAAFDTRVDLPAVLTGRASKGIARQLCGHGATLISEPESFLVTKGDQLEPGEEARARAWGSHLAVTLEDPALQHRVG